MSAGAAGIDEFRTPRATCLLAPTPSPLTLAAALYLVFFVPLVVASRWLEGLGPRRH